MDLPATFADARPRLTAHPIGRTPLGIRSLRLALDEALDALDATVPVAADVLVGVVLEAEDAEVAVTEELLKQWGVTIEQALAASFEVHGAEEPRLERIAGGGLVVADRSFAAFVLRTPSTARGLVAGTPVALVPTDRHLVLATLEDAGSLAGAARVADEILQGGGRAVSAVPLVAGADGWRAASSGAEIPASDVTRHFAALMYGWQRPLLQAFYDRTGQDCLVADAVVARRPDGVLQLIATITDGVPAAVPWVDMVSLVRDGAVVGTASMGELTELDGVLTPLADLDPPRWYAARFPAELVRP